MILSKRKKVVKTSEKAKLKKADIEWLFIAIMIILIIVPKSVQADSIDVIPPKGSITIKNATIESGEKIVNGSKVLVGISATDNVSSANEIKVYISINEIPDTKKLDEEDWETYYDGYTKAMRVSESGEKDKVYVSIKDKSGNTNTIFTSASATYNIIYNPNGGSIVSQQTHIGYYGMPYKVTNELPINEGKYFMGWSTNANATVASYMQGETIPASVFSGTQDDIILYAIWSDASNDLPLLASKVKVGDFVEYPVNYENVTGSTLTGWRVINVDKETGIVKLVSAGVPLTYNHSANNTVSSELELTKNFGNIEISTSDDNTFIKSGFSSTFENEFFNRYTQEEGDTVVVSAMTAEDINSVVSPSTFNSSTIELNDSKYEQLFCMGGTDYYLATSNTSYTSTEYLYKINASTGEISSVYIGEYGIRPVVTLKDSVRTTGYNNKGIWQLEMPKEKTLTLSLNANGGAIETWETEKNVVVGDSYGKLPKPTREYHEFIGWYTDPESGEEVNKDTTVTITQDHTVYAHWEKLVPVLYTEVSCGDIVNFPVYYEDINDSEEHRWMVLSKDDVNHTVDLITVGIPLTYSYQTRSTARTAISNLTTNFLTTTYADNNFFTSSLEELFNNGYTLLDDDGKPKVRSVSLADVKKYSTYATSNTSLSEYDVFAKNQNYWLPDTSTLYYVSSANQIATVSSSRYSTTYKYGVRPVVTIKSDVKVIDQSGDGSWNINAKLNKITVTFNTNGGTTTQKNKIVVTGQKYGTLPIPEKRNKEFAGWYTAQEGGTLITEDSIVKVTENQELYAIYKEDMADLSSQVSVGDYVNYPVKYNNLEVDGEISELNGWRVWSKDVDLDGNSSPGTVNIISAGIPLIYYHGGAASATKENITNNFLETPFGTEIQQYTEIGIINPEEETLTELFDNGYTKKVNDKLQVRSITSDDLYRVKNATTMSGMDLSGNDLYTVGAAYWTDEKYRGNEHLDLYYINSSGKATVASSAQKYGIRIIVSLKDNMGTPGKDEDGSHNIAAKPLIRSTVTFDANGGTVSEESKVVTETMAYGTLPIPVKEGDTFLRMVHRYYHRRNEYYRKHNSNTKSRSYNLCIVEDRGSFTC
jgi:uncharacterized repeat protein (TIGR02543 family)